MSRKRGMIVEQVRGDVTCQSSTYPGIEGDINGDLLIKQYKYWFFEIIHEIDDGRSFVLYSQMRSLDLLIWHVVSSYAASSF